MPLLHRSRLLPAVFFLVFILTSCREQPTPPASIPSGLTIAGGVPTIASGATLQLVAVAQYRDGTSRDVSADATWTNAPARAGIVQAGGKFIPASDSIGVETVTAAYQGHKAIWQIEVTKRAVFFSVTPVLVQVAAGSKLQYEASAAFHDGSQAFVTEKVQWSVSPGLAATIDANGMLQAVPGSNREETVTATFQVLRAQSKVNVQAAPTHLFETVIIPAGTFMMGDDNSSFDDQRPAHEVYVDAFEIGTHEITNAQYVQFLNDGLRTNQLFYESSIVVGKLGAFAFLPYMKICPSDEFPEKFVEYVQIEPNVFEFQVVPGFEQHPVVRLTWYGAAAFCAFYGYRLPTEAEWERAARGGMQLAYGTASGELTHELANYTGVGSRDVYERVAPVGKFPPNPFGLYDMSGNAAEYVFDLYAADYYQNSPRNNPHGPGPLKPLGRLPNAIGSVMWRGGSWLNSTQGCRATYRGAFVDLPDQCLTGGAVAGFRVARSVQ